MQDAFATNPNEWHDTDGDGIGDNADTDDNNNGILDGDEPVPLDAAPVLIAPIHESVVDPMAVLKSSAFHSPLAGVTHVQSRWQVFREDDDFCVLDMTSKTALTSLKVPKLILDEETRYFWRVQYIDSKAKVSPWSDYGYFSTVNTGRDLNANGIPDAQEVAATVDLDRDGVMDAAEPKMKAVKVEGTSTMIGVSVKGSATALGVESVESENRPWRGLTARANPARCRSGWSTSRSPLLTRSPDQGCRDSTSRSRRPSGASGTSTTGCPARGTTSPTMRSSPRTADRSP